MNRILGFLVAAFGFIIALLGIKNERLQRRSAEREADIAKASEKATSNAASALTEGLENENKPITRNGRTLK